VRSFMLCTLRLVRQFVFGWSHTNLGATHLMSDLQASINLHRFRLFVLLPQFVDIVVAAAREAALKQSLQDS